MHFPPYTVDHKRETLGIPSCLDPWFGIASTVDIFVSSLLYSLCSVTALQLILLLVLSSRFTRSQQPGPGWRVDHPGTCRCRCTT